MLTRKEKRLFKKVKTYLKGIIFGGTLSLHLFITIALLFLVTLLFSVGIGVAYYILARANIVTDSPSGFISSMITSPLILGALFIITVPIDIVVGIQHIKERILRGKK